MAAVNGATPTSPGNKRKRADDEAQTQKDILEILSQSGSSFLQHAIEDTAAKERSPKKVKLSSSITSDVSSTIASNLSNGRYNTLNDLQKDAEHVSESLISAIRQKAKDREGQNGRLLVADLKEMQQARAFEQVVKDVVEQHNVSAVERRNGVVSRSGTVLTLFGNAQTPKQLFSSMQKAPTGRTELPVEEMSLPIGLSATKVMSVPEDGRRKGPTLEEAFPPPYNLPTLHPPKSHKRSSTRDETIKWEFKDPLASRSKKGGYTTQSLSVGEWLGYGGTDSKDEPSSPREKRKLRDRVLSSGESTQPPPSRASLEDSLAKEEEALFRRAYSSFAPSHDNTKAVVPEETKSMVWWNTVGSKRYKEAFAIDPALLDEQPPPPPKILPDVEILDEDFDKVVEEFEEQDGDLPDAESVRDKTDVKEVLGQISELLETLASHQRIRNAILHSSSSASRTPISPSPMLASKLGRPDSPAEDEMSTYHALRRELAYLVLKVPPYAVAKLHGDRLAELGISKLIPFRTENVKGTMEEDQVARQAKQTAMATAAGIATLTRTTSGSQHYSSTNQRTPAIGQAANTRYGHSGQFGAGRTPIAQSGFNRPIGSQSTYGTPSATAPRPGYGQPNQYSRPASYGQNGQHYYQRQGPTGSSNYGGFGQYGSTPQSQHRPTYSSSQPLAQYQQRSQAAAQNAVAYQTNTQSPFNRPTYRPPLQPSPAPRTDQQFPPPQPPRSSTPSSYPSQPQTPVNGVTARPVAPRTSSGTPQPSQGSSMQANGHP